MSDYTIESPNKKKKPYYKNKNKNKQKAEQKPEAENTEALKNQSPEPKMPVAESKPQKNAEKPQKTGKKQQKINQNDNQKSQKQAKPQKDINKDLGKDQKEASKDKEPQKDIKDTQDSKTGKKHKKPNRDKAEKADAPAVVPSEPTVAPITEPLSPLFINIVDSKTDYIPDKNAEGFSKDPPFTDFSTAYDPIADFVASREEKDEKENDLCETKTVIGIRFRTSAKTYYFDPNGVEYLDNSFAIVETSRGVEFGYVVMGNHDVPVSKTFLPLKPALRPATKADKEHYAENRQKEAEAFALWGDKVREHGLDMKLIDVEYTFDNTKLLFYFTSEGRVDFRELVKDLASLFHCRIELRQMGIRDEAKVLGGLGVCGRAFCCGTFLPDFAQVSIKMAKEQSISLNSSKISGACGRLMCCLRFEHETYLEAIQKTPSVDWRVNTPFGTGVVVETKPLAGLIKVKLDANPDAAPTVCAVEDAVVLGRDRSHEKQETEDDEELS